jgi:hypothetical protein
VVIGVILVTPRGLLPLFERLGERWLRSSSVRELGTGVARARTLRANQQSEVRVREYGR